jgi:hypothetical protein
MLFNVLALAFLGVVVTGIINTTCIKENTHFPYIVLKGESVCSDNSKVLQSSIVSINVMHKKEGSSLVQSERIDLLTYRC